MDDLRADIGSHSAISGLDDGCSGQEQARNGLAVLKMVSGPYLFNSDIPSRIDGEQRVEDITNRCILKIIGQR